MDDSQSTIRLSKLDRPLGALAALRYAVDLTHEAREVAYQQVREEIEYLRDKVERLEAELPADNNTILNETRKYLRWRVKAARGKVRRAHESIQVVVGQRDAARRALEEDARDLAELLKLVEEAEAEDRTIHPGEVRSLMDWYL